MKILTVIGTRPEAIKLAPVLTALESAPEPIRSVVCVTAQHRQLLDQVLELFAIKHRYDLDVMTADQSPSRVASAVLDRMEDVLNTEHPDWLLVQGDTTSAMAASLAAFHARTRVAHVEAGLRTSRRNEPFPEEINRRIVGLLADLHFAPTSFARENLLREGVPVDRVVTTGNTVVDAVLHVANLPCDLELTQVGHLPEMTRVVLVTAHRRENLGEPLKRICSAIRILADRYIRDVIFVYPVHPNPSVTNTVHQELDGIVNVRLVDPLDYLTFVHLMRRSHFLLTDSGGVQEEAPSFGKPVLVLRNVTERGEAIDAGSAHVVGTEEQAIVSNVAALLDDPVGYARMRALTNPFGDGHAADRIVHALVSADEPADS